jgi:hypothetical protein
MMEDAKKVQAMTEAIGALLEGLSPEEQGEGLIVFAEKIIALANRADYQLPGGGREMLEENLKMLIDMRAKGKLGDLIKK